MAAATTTELDVDLPKGIVKRIVKAKLAEIQAHAAQAGQRGADPQVSKEALSAFSQATKVFITFVTTAAYDICRENKRSTVAPQDILQALQELEFGTFIEGLEARLLELHNKRKTEKETAKEKDTARDQRAGQSADIAMEGP